MSQTELLVDSEVETVSEYGLTADTLHEKCFALARNLWWSWNHEVINLFRDLDPIRWRQLDHNPIALLSEFTPERLEMRARGSDGRIEERLSRAVDDAAAAPDVTIINVGDAAGHAERLVKVIKDGGAT